jgi:crotonobetainyl-CoA:carnitine CoA-transferase CaiB-like acyl-CoA transferase
MELADSYGTQLPSVRSPVLLPASPLVYERPSPRLGEHTDEVFAEIGITADAKLPSD